MSIKVKDGLDFDLSKLEDPAKAIEQEWLYENDIGNYAASGIIGLNTRRSHGLFNIKDDNDLPAFIILSHLQEDYYHGRQSRGLFCVEYESKLVCDGFGFLKSFKFLDYPVFSYEVDQVRIKKRIVLSNFSQRVIISYSVTGNIEPGSRLIIRPFFAFREVNRNIQPDDYVTTELFQENEQYRFLPYPNAPEVFIWFSGGELIHAPLWYHRFYYRNEEKTDARQEDLLNPGFIEIPIKGETQIHFSVGLQKMPWNRILDEVKDIPFM
ncbi:MAG: glycogen debranching enzyme N-terminal domain-containing protein [Calditrichia bacterium]